MGFDMVVHSATKYLAGHHDLIAGAAVGSRAWMGRVRDMIIYLGGAMDPGGAVLLMRGLKTLEGGVRRQGETAMAVAPVLSRSPKGSRVHYPGLPAHPDR